MISKNKITKILTALFQKIKVKENIYFPIVEGLVGTSLRGVDSHGIRLAPHYIRATLLGRINPRPKFTFKQTAPATMLIDANHTYGITAGVIAMEKAIQMAHKIGVGVVVVKNSSHFGAGAIYGLMAAKAKMIGRAMTPVENLVVPYGGKKTFLGTNAYCYSAPMQGEGPFVLDMSTTNINKNRLMMYQRENKPLEMGWAVDQDGKYTTNSHKVAALTHFGTYKGYGIALETEIFSSLLSGMPFGPHITHMFPLSKEKRNLSHYFEAIDIKRFQPVTTFKKRLRQMADELRAIPPAKGFKKVMVPGDPEKEIYKKRAKQGIPLTTDVIDEYNKLFKELGLPMSL